ncbi:MAG TPA: hypothetical protein DDZ51_29930 [Planctomycetaceae bacterium]|nr:hypothetical protein [Planctomycetaceae bacterium]
MKTKLKSKADEKPTPSTTAERVIRENEIIKSDRVELMNAATRVIGQLNFKQILPQMRCDYPAEAIALDTSERMAYDAALSFLTRQFEQGYSLHEPHEKKVELHYGSSRRTPS